MSQIQTQGSSWSVRKKHPNELELLTSSCDKGTEHSDRLMLTTLCVAVVETKVE